MSYLEELQGDFKNETSLYIDSFPTTISSDTDLEIYFVRAVFFDAIDKILDSESEDLYMSEECIRKQEKVWDWIYSREVNSQTFSFNACCRVLGIDSNQMRIGMESLANSKQHYQYS